MLIPYTQGNGYAAVSLPYSGETAAMDIIVPDAGRFKEIESALTSDRFNEIIGNMAETTLMLHLPKFKFLRQHYEENFWLDRIWSALRKSKVLLMMYVILLKCLEL